MNKGENIQWIEGTPLGLNLRKGGYVSPHLHEDIIEITMCLSGEMKFSCCFEEFVLRAGEYILVDKDIHYFYDGRDAQCASFYIDLNQFETKISYIKNLIFVCEHTEDSVKPHNTSSHKKLRGVLLALLLFMMEHPERDEEFRETITRTTEKIVAIVMDKFDIIFWYDPDMEISDKLFMRYRMMMDYMFRHHGENVVIGDIAKEFGLSKSYTTEFISKYVLGFQKIMVYIRLCYAEQYLIHTDMSMLEISEACNFSDPKYFYKAFRVWHDCTPGQFKKKYLTGAEGEGEETLLQFEDIKESLISRTKMHLMDTSLQSR